jgi:hypothetical protein
MRFTVVMIRLRFKTFRSESPEGGTAKLKNLCHPGCAPLAPPLGNRRQCKLLSSRRLISAANGSETAIEEIMGVGDRFRAQTNRTGLLDSVAIEGLRLTDSTRGDTDPRNRCGMSGSLQIVSYR